MQTGPDALTCTDLMFTGLALSEGDHRILLCYTTPGMAVGDA